MTYSDRRELRCAVLSFFHTRVHELLNALSFGMNMAVHPAVESGILRLANFGLAHKALLCYI